MASDAQHYDVVVEVDRTEVELLADFADLAVREAEAFLETGATIVLADRVFVALFVVLDSDAFEVAIFEDSVLHEIITVEPANAFKRIIVVLPNTDDPIFFQNEAIPLSFVEALLVREQLLVSKVDNHRLISRDLLFLTRRG